MTAKLQALRKKHDFLEYELAKEVSFAHKDDTKIKRLKKKKLQVKDMITRLSRIRSVRRLRRYKKSSLKRTSFAYIGA